MVYVPKKVRQNFRTLNYNAYEFTSLMGDLVSMVRAEARRSWGRLSRLRRPSLCSLQLFLRCFSSCGQKIHTAASSTPTLEHVKRLCRSTTKLGHKIPHLPRWCSSNDRGTKWIHNRWVVMHIRYILLWYKWMDFQHFWTEVDDWRFDLHRVCVFNWGKKLKKIPLQIWFSTEFCFSMNFV